MYHLPISLFIVRFYIAFLSISFRSLLGCGVVFTIGRAVYKLERIMKLYRRALWVAVELAMPTPLSAWSAS